MMFKGLATDDVNLCAHTCSQCGGFRTNGREVVRLLLAPEFFQGSHVWDLERMTGRSLVHFSIQLPLI